MLDFPSIRSRLESALGSRAPRRLEVPGFRTASVLVPILNRPDGPTVLLIRRTETVKEHRGQVAFPGGHNETGETPLQTALREADEEIALAASDVSVVGQLDDRPAISGYVVTPVVGLVEHPPARFDLCAHEVTEAFEVSLPCLLDPKCVTHVWRGASEMPPGAPFDALLSLGRHFPEFDQATRRAKLYFYDAGLGSERVIWGLTGYILKDLLDVLFPDRTEVGRYDAHPAA